MKRSGFTMIELIFVIVILGILASVAIPKLAATRDDAKISKIASDAATLVSDAGSYFTSQGAANWGAKNWSDVTNVSVGSTATDTTGGGSSSTITNAAGVFINADASHNCLKITATADGNLTVANGTDTSSVICSEVQAMTENIRKTHSFGGVGIIR